MIPNLLTTVRLLLVPLFVYFIFGNENYALAAATFLVSGFTDIVDGFVARKFNMITDFGKVYDPFVDKLMQITVIVCLAIAKILPVWIIVIIIVKEVSMIVIGGILYFKDIVVHSVWYGKACTVLFYA
ncbi:MAG: CDP-alcohol phosphatidyltransferase family protein, partial [Oscillospiraceae bacterium]